MSAFRIDPLLRTDTVVVSDTVCDGSGEHAADATWHAHAHLVFPYRGLWVRHDGDELAVAEAGQVLLANARTHYRTHHPVQGGDASLVVQVEEAMLRELAPPSLLREGDAFAFAEQRLRLDARASALVAMLRHSLREAIAEPLEAESLALTLVTRALGPRTARVAGSTAGRQRLADRTKLVLASDLSRRWTLAEIAAEIGVSPVYLTQVFQQVEGLPLYRYQLRLRLARALDRIGDIDDLARLGIELGFSSHSHFSAAFQQAYGRSPSEFRDAVIARRQRRG
ncbi:helix-turn-helix transcriptional regulator [Dokdonella sp.]|uniref:helix-turn-helix transcriptional regulator n=1 Tax=Dokdonella sp. TaxID=2291710 RepID=UPI002F3F800C